MFTHNQANPPLHKWMRECKHLLARNEKAREIGDRIQISTRQPKNLQRIVGGFKGQTGGGQDTSPDAGCFKCNRCKVSCPVMIESKVFQSTSTGKEYRIRQRVDWVIYLSTYVQYVKDNMSAKAKTPSRKDTRATNKKLKMKLGALATIMGEGGAVGMKNFQFKL